MFAHPDTIHTVRRLQQQDLLAEAERDRLARLAVPHRRVPLAVALLFVRGMVGGWLVRLGRRLEGAPAVGAAPAAGPSTG